MGFLTAKQFDRTLWTIPKASERRAYYGIDEKIETGCKPVSVGETRA